MTYKAYLVLHLDFATGQVTRASILSEKFPTTEFGNGLMFHPTGFEAMSTSSWEEAQSTLLYFLKRSIQNGYWGPHGSHVRTLIWDTLLESRREDEFVPSLSQTP